MINILLIIIIIFLFFYHGWLIKVSHVSIFGLWTAIAEFGACSEVDPLRHVHAAERRERCAGSGCFNAAGIHRSSTHLPNQSLTVTCSTNPSPFTPGLSGDQNTWHRLYRCRIYSGSISTSVLSHFGPYPLRSFL